MSHLRLVEPAEARLLEGDCFALLPTFPEGSVDLLLTDPPYGTTDLEWDVAVDWPRFWSEVYRLVKPTGWFVLFCQQPMATDLINSNRKHFRYELIWEKTCAVGFLDAKRRPLRAHENICVFGRTYKGATFNPQKTPGKPYTTTKRDGRSNHYGQVRGGITTENTTGERYPRSVLHAANRSGKGSFHPTAKPVELLRWLIATYSNPGDLVLDPFVGSGSTLVAARALDRHSLGIEREAKYLQVARERLAQAEADGTLHTQQAPEGASHA